MVYSRSENCVFPALRCGPAGQGFAPGNTMFYGFFKRDQMFWLTNQVIPYDQMVCPMNKEVPFQQHDIDFEVPRLFLNQKHIQI